MPITKDKKVEIIKILKEITAKAKSLIFVNFHGLSVSKISDLRRKLREQKVGYRVAKKTLIKKTLSNLKIEGNLPELEGEIALAWGDDSIAPARGVYEFQKKYKDGIKIIGGIFEGKYMNQVEMNEIASIPPLQVLYGQFVNIINSPIQGLVIALNQIAESKES
ncbi:50S ribosomal protein L10 [Candidatus Nomurabacteria bacterium RIFCSPLOWO2_01_FULL_33_24]|uniref:Large ribosomal subunit protein uL10 n=1 Tax=Candidatus Nomurabacteria bacterium RIFCSPLOWO2_01_FULL_33_24 TaxID=1801765 RepID=A0A1F6X2S1_9BACT|nr:MAG: 50S ribosomal protein L10 [Candidatus Nomurabacteria bacterium RIFCSPLOWO2_01_FULL_33_24]